MHGWAVPTRAGRHDRVTAGRAGAPRFREESMRGLSAYWASLAAVAVSAFALCASPVPGPVPAGPQAAADDALRAEAVNYAHLMLNYIAYIELKYARPVSQVDLAEAALAGL